MARTQVDRSPPSGPPSLRPTVIAVTAAVVSVAAVIVGLSAPLRTASDVGATVDAVEAAGRAARSLQDERQAAESLARGGDPAAPAEFNVARVRVDSAMSQAVTAVSDSDIPAADHLGDRLVSVRRDIAVLRADVGAVTPVAVDGAVEGAAVVDATAAARIAADYARVVQDIGEATAATGAALGFSRAGAAIRRNGLLLPVADALAAERDVGYRVLTAGPAPEDPARLADLALTQNMWLARWNEVVSDDERSLLTVGLAPDQLTGERLSLVDGVLGATLDQARRGYMVDIALAIAAIAAVVALVTAAVAVAVRSRRGRATHRDMPLTGAAPVGTALVNVARRNQALLGRQLTLIDALERGEEDPDTLADLYRLDHLATRMRRNAESLLVLAGIEGGRRLRRPMAMSDVVRTAAGEIEQYERVDVQLAADPLVHGHAALPLAHLVAEIVENATLFSDVDTRVVVSAETTSDGLRVTVTDSGLGMSDDEIAAATRQIHEAPAPHAGAETRLGFHVVGRLARRLSADVSLRRNADQGLAVMIDMPASLLALPAPTHAPTSTTAPAADIPPLPRRARHTSGDLDAARVPSTAVVPGADPITVPVTGHGPAAGLPLRRRDRRALDQGPDQNPRPDPATPAAAPAPDTADTPASLRRRAVLASQALSELSSLSSYRPEKTIEDSPLQRRERPATGHTSQPPSGPLALAPDRERSPEAVRTLLSGFTAGVQRGRGDAPSAPPPDPSPTERSQT